jgi:hypothetical protein
MNTFILSNYSELVDFLSSGMETSWASEAGAFHASWSGVRVRQVGPGKGTGGLAMRAVRTVKLVLAGQAGEHDSEGGPVWRMQGRRSGWSFCTAGNTGARGTARLSYTSLCRAPQCSHSLG